MQKLFNILLIIIFCCTSVNAAWYNPAWNYRTKITIQAASVNGTVNELPVFVDLSHLPGSFFDNVSANGADLRVTRSDGSTEIAREVVSLSKTANTGELWFKAPSLSSAANTEFYIYYGNNTATAPLANSTFGSQNVWSNGFVTVYHMNALTNGTASVLDSTSFANHGTPIGGMSGGSDIVSGRTGSAIDFDGVDDTMFVNSFDQTLASYSVSVWHRAKAAIIATNSIVSLMNQSFGHGILLELNPGSYRFLHRMPYSGGGGTNLNYGIAHDNNMRFNVLTYNQIGNGMNHFFDGVLVASISSTTDEFDSSSKRLYLGSLGTGARFFNGEIDECRIANKVRNRNWIQTEYNNQNSPLSFYTLSAEQGSLAEFPQRLTVTIKASQINGSVTQMPVFINLDHMPQHFFTNVKGSGADIRITTSDGTSQVPVEIVSLDKATTNGEIWFRAPSLTSASDTVFYLYYGLNGATLPAANSVFGSQNVWSNGFVAVYHMNSLTNGTASVLDSTSFANHGTPFGGMSAGSDLVAGRTGSAIDFDGSNDMIDINNDTELRIGIGTISSWIKTADAGSGFRGIVTKQNAYSSFLNTNVLILFDWGGGGTRSSSQNLANNTWRHNAISFQSGIGSGTNFYTDGVLSATSSMTVLNQTSKIGIGAGSGAPGIQHLSGNIDEVRVANKIRNRNWILTEYNNQNSPGSFYTIDLNENLNNWSTRNKITIPSTVVNGSVSELPVYVNLRHLPANFWTSVKSSGSDIRMTTAGGTPLAIELVSIDKVNKTGELWFKAPTLISASHNHFYIYSGNNGGSFASPVSQYGSQAVWSNGFVAVYHMQNASNGSVTILDSSSGAFHATGFGNIATANFTNSKLGHSLNFDGVNDYTIGPLMNKFQFNNGDTITLSAWHRRSGSTAGNVVGEFGQFTLASAWHYSQIEVRNTNGSTASRAWPLTVVGLGNSAANNWSYSVMRHNGGSNLTTGAHNGVISPNSASGNRSTAWEGGYPAGAYYFLGAPSASNMGSGAYFTGRIDEFRISKVVRSDNWIRTEYNNQSFPERFYMINNLSLMNATFFGRMF